MTTLNNDPTVHFSPAQIGAPRLPARILWDLVTLSRVKMGQKKTFIRRCFISSVHGNVIPSVLSLSLSVSNNIIPPLPITAHFKRNGSCLLVRAVIRFTQLSADGTACPRMAGYHTCPGCCFLYSMMFSSFSLYQGYYTGSCVSPLQCNRIF